MLMLVNKERLLMRYPLKVRFSGLAVGAVHEGVSFL